MAHISFAVKLCLMQSKYGRKLNIEQPVGARAWGTQLMNKLLFVKGVGKANFDFCMFQMKTAKDREVRLARKRTSIISNSQALRKEVTKYQASGRHQHVTTREWKTPDVQRRVLQNRVRHHLPWHPGTSGNRKWATGYRAHGAGSRHQEHRAQPVPGPPGTQGGHRARKK